MENSKNHNRYRRSKEKRIGPIKRDTGELLSSDQQIAESMNTFFTNIGVQLASKFEDSSKDEAQYICRVTPTMSELYLTTEKFTEKLKKLNPRKAAGHDNITTREMKLLSEDMSPCLFSICSQSYLEGKFPMKLNGR